MRDELEKIALNRYERALKAGEIGQPEIERVGRQAANVAANFKYPTGPLPGLPERQGMFGDTIPAVPAQVFKPGEISDHDQAFLRESRNSMWGPSMWGNTSTDLNPEQLARHRKLHGMQADQAMKSLGGVKGNMPMMGPATVAGHVMVGDNAGQFLRDAAEGDSKQQLLGTLPKFVRERAGYKNTPLDVDQTLRHAVVEHEGGEKALFHGAMSTQPRSAMQRILGTPQGGEAEALPARPFASHFGATPVLEEKQVTWRDPAAQEIFQKLRASNPDDAKIDALHRQFGGRPDMPLNLGGRGHAEIERRLGAATPEVEQAMKMRARMAPKGMTHGISAEGAEKLMGTTNVVHAGLKERATQLGGIRGDLLSRGADWFRNRGQATVDKAVKTVADPDNLVQRIMHLRSAVRR